MVRAGAPVDDTIGRLEPHLASDDIVIDGANSNFRDTMRRATRLRERGSNWSAGLTPRIRIPADAAIERWTLSGRTGGGPPPYAAHPPHQGDQPRMFAAVTLDHDGQRFRVRLGNAYEPRNRTRPRASGHMLHLG